MVMGQGRYPITSLHDFLAQLTVEFRRFRIVSIFTVAAYSMILLFVVRFAFRLLTGERQLTTLRVATDLTFALISVGAIAFTMYSCYRQHAFFRRWSRMFEGLERKERELFAKPRASS